MKQHTMYTEFCLRFDSEWPKISNNSELKIGFLSVVNVLKWLNMAGLVLDGVRDPRSFYLVPL